MPESSTPGCWMGAVPGKRYVLLESDGVVSEVAEELAEHLGNRFGGMKLIEVRGRPHAVILKTNNVVAEQLRGLEGGLLVKGQRFLPVSTSGAVGNLKRRASEAKANGEIHE